VQPFQDVTEVDDLELLAAIQCQQWPWRGEYLMAAFDLGVCADESGIHDDAPLSILAGYIASVNQWIRFDERWQAVLQRNDVFDFHSKEFFAVNDQGVRVGRYKRWSNPDERQSYGDWHDDKAVLFIGDLLAVIQATDMTPLGAYVETKDFWSFTYGERKYLTGGKLGANLKWVSSGAPSKPYFLLFDHCIAESGQLTNAGMKTIFVFDQQKNFEGRALQQFGESLAVFAREGNQIGRRLAGVLFQERDKVLGLQAADLYTHCWYRHIMRPQLRGPRYEALDRLTVKVPGMKQYSREHMAGLFRNLPVNVREFVRDYVE
jgi:uncharacterized protein DUF3800